MGWNEPDVHAEVRFEPRPFVVVSQTDRDRVLVFDLIGMAVFPKRQST